MKIKVDRKGFADKFQLAGSVVSSSILNPLYLNVKIEATDGKLVLSATDLEVGVRAVMTEGVKVEEPGMALLPEQRVASVLRTCPDAEIELTATDGHIEITTSDSQFRFASEPVEDFVSVPEVADEAGAIEIDPPTLAGAVRKTILAIAEERDRYTLNGVFFNVRDKEIDVVGADGNRMALVTKKIVNTEGVSRHCIIPRKGAEQLIRLGSTSKSPVKILIDEHQIMAKGDDASLSSVLLEGLFPNYQQFIPTEPKVSIEFDRARLQSVVQRAALVISSDSIAVTFRIEPGQLVLESESVENGAATVKMPITYDGEPLTMIFNPVFIEDFLKVADRETITWEYFEDQKPVLFRSGRDYGYYLMPIAVER